MPRLTRTSPPPARLALVVSLALCLGSPAPARPAERREAGASTGGGADADAAAAAAVIEGSLARNGGESAWRAIRSRTIDYSVQVEGQAKKGRATLKQRAPRSFAMTRTIPGRGEWTMVYDGLGGWVTAAAGAGRRLDPAELGQADAEAPIQPALDWRQRARAEVETTELVAGREAYVIRFTRLDGTVFRELYDVRTFDLVGRDVGGKHIIYSDYRPVAGVRLPYRIREESPDGVIVLTVERVRTNPDLPERLFHLPAVPAAASTGLTTAPEATPGPTATPTPTPTPESRVRRHPKSKVEAPAEATPTPKPTPTPVPKATPTPTPTPTPVAAPADAYAPVWRFTLDGNEFLAQTRDGVTVYIGLGTLPRVPVGGLWLLVAVANDSSGAVALRAEDVVVQGAGRKKPLIRRTAPELVAAVRKNQGFMQLMNQLAALTSSSGATGAPRSSGAAQVHDAHDASSSSPVDLARSAERKAELSATVRTLAQGASLPSWEQWVDGLLLRSGTVDPGQRVAGMVVTERHDETRPVRIRVPVGPETFEFEFTTPWTRAID